MPSFAANGIDISFERRGHGPPLLLLIGSGSTVAGMGLLIDTFAGAFDVVAHDHRGMGLTSLPDEPFTMADCAADSLAVADHLGWERCAVVGVSFGGMVAQELAVTWPDRVARLALCCTSAGGAGGSSYPLQELEAMAPDERMVAGMRLLDTRFTPAFLAENPKEQGLVDYLGRQELGERSPAQREGEAAQRAARSGHDVWDRLPAVSSPTLVASGRYDGIAPPENGERIASRISGAELRLYDGGHAFFVQDPAALPEIITFLSTVA
jgi:pimeloyl-ACP methyl ester carboxylesterase